MKKINIKELRDIAQYKKEKKIWRVFSIYFTYIFVKIGLTANQVTLFGFLVGVLGGILLLIGGFKYWFVGIICFLLSYMLDYSDGEVARFNREVSAEGEFLDGTLHSGFMNSYFIISAAVGLYRELDSIFPLVFSLAMLAFLYINKGIEIFLIRRSLFPISTSELSGNMKRTIKLRIFMGTQKYILDEPVRVVWLGLGTLVDYVASTSAINPIFINWCINFRLLWFGWYTAIFLMSIIIKFQDTRRMAIGVDH